MQKIDLKLRTQLRAAGEQESNPYPGYASKSYFQGARPIDAKRVRIFLLPGIKLSGAFFGVAGISTEDPSLCQSEQMLVPIQFPNNLVIANQAEVEIGNFEPRQQGTPFLVDWIPMPIDGSNVIDLRITQQLKSMSANFVGFAKNRIDF